MCLGACQAHYIPMRVSRHYDDGAVANDGVRLAAGVGVAVAVATTGIVIVNVYRLKL